MKNKFWVFTRKEKQGLIAVLLIIVVLNAIRWYNSESFEFPQEEITSAPIEIKYESSSKKKDDFNNKSDSPKKKKRLPKKKTVILKIDPNKAAEEDWKSLGFSSKQSKVIVNYQKKYGPFYSKEEVQKVFVIDSKKYIQIKKYLSIDTTYLTQFQIEINSAPDSLFKRISGIGSVLSKRIVSYRELLGGFYRVDQLAEVYGVDSVLIQSNRKRFKIISLSSKNINELEKFILWRHPYLSKSMKKEVQEMQKAKKRIIDFETWLLRLNEDQLDVNRAIKYFHGDKIED